MTMRREASRSSVWSMVGVCVLGLGAGGCKSLQQDADTSEAQGTTTSAGYLDTENGLQSLNGLSCINGLNGSNGLNGNNGLNTNNGLNANNGLNTANGLGSINGLNTANGFQGQNGFNTVNGFQAQNGLGSINGLNIANGLNTANGLGSYAGLMTGDGGRKVVTYLARCALPAGDTLVKADQNNNSYTFAGGIGLAPEWKTGGCNEQCAEKISACLMAHINSSGVHIPLWMDSPMSTIGWGQSPWFPTREGTFFGQIMVANAANNLDAYYCNGPGSDKNVVPGRLGANQGSVPYADAFPTSAGMDGKCGNSLIAHSTGGCVDNSAGDGATQCKLNGTMWNNPITVWRGQTIQAEDAQGGAWLMGGGPPGPTGVGGSSGAGGTGGASGSGGAGGSGGAMGYGCIPPASGCYWTPGGLGFVASQCSTPGSNGCSIIVDDANGMGKRVGYFNGPSKGLKFSNVNVACAGTATVSVYTTNGDAVGSTSRHLQFMVNGGAPQDFAFPGAADWKHPVGMNVSLSGFNAGSNNTIYVTASGSNGAPDLDWIEITNTGGACGSSVSGTCDESKWVESSSANSGSEGAGNDGNLGTRFTTNRAMQVGDYYKVDMTGTVYLSGIVLNNSQTSPNDYAAKVDVYSSNDGSTWNKIVTGATGGTTTTIPFTKTLMRYMKVQISQANSNNNYWSIGELQTTCTTN
jgi:hypothetical protein